MIFAPLFALTAINDFEPICIFISLGLQMTAAKEIWLVIIISLSQTGL
jgi:hypothetical protein